MTVSTWMPCRSAAPAWHRRGTFLRTRWMAVRARSEAGMATAEYAIATLAAVAFAGMLLVIMRSDEVRGMLLGIIEQALSIGG